MGDHRLAHRADRPVERGQHPVGGDVDPVVVGVEGLGDQVRVAKLVALPLAHVVEADAEGRQAPLSLSASRATIRLESRPPDSSTPTGTSATIRRSTAVAQSVQHRVGPVARVQSAASAAAEARAPVGLGAPRAVGLDHHHRRRRQLPDALQDRVRRAARPRASSGSGEAPRDRARCRSPPPASSAGSVEAKRRRAVDLGQVQRLDARAGRAPGPGAGARARRARRRTCPKKCSTQSWPQRA